MRRCGYHCDCSTHVDTLVLSVLCYSSDGLCGGRVISVIVVHLDSLYCAFLCYSSDGPCGDGFINVIVVCTLIHCVVSCHSSGSGGGQCGGVIVVHTLIHCVVLSSVTAPAVLVVSVEV